MYTLDDLLGKEGLDQDTGEKLATRAVADVLGVLVGEGHPGRRG